MHTNYSCNKGGGGVVKMWLKGSKRTISFI